jgi:hypothetical protein
MPYYFYLSFLEMFQEKDKNKNNKNKRGCFIDLYVILISLRMNYNKNSRI